MPRKPRLHVPGGLFHIVLRGNGRQDIFFDDHDRRLWEQYLQAGLNRHAHRIHAYCWMTNHIHMAIQAHTTPLARFVGTLSSRYAKAVNRKLGRSGHLFERRYRSTLVQAETYLQELVRYIHLNPVRAGMVNGPADYPWSSHTAYLGGPLPPWLTKDWVLAALGPTEKRATQSYAKFMLGTQSDALLGKFRASPDQDDRILGISSVTEVARRFGRNQPSLSRTMSRLRDRRSNR